MAENFDLIFGSSASQSYSWNDSDYQNGWQTVGDTPPTREQFDALQRRNDTKAKELNSRLSPLEDKAAADGRQTATTYAKGVMVTADGLPNGWLLECVVAGTTGTGALEIPSPLVIGGTIVDGTVTWKIIRTIDTSNAPLVAGYNGKQTFTSSGTFTPTITGNYKITLQGAGGGGGGAGSSASGKRGGGGGGAGGHGEFYERLTAGTSYTFTIGAGGAGGTGTSSGGAGAGGGNGGASSITINGNNYVASGGFGGGGGAGYEYGGAGAGGNFSVNTTIVSRGSAGGAGDYLITDFAFGGTGGGLCGTNLGANSGGSSICGSGGGGGAMRDANNGNAGEAGGDGYITFEWQTASLV